MALWLSVLAALAEDLGCNSHFWESDAIVWPLWALHTQMHTCRHAGKTLMHNN